MLQLLGRPIGRPHRRVESEASLDPGVLQRFGSSGSVAGLQRRELPHEVAAQGASLEHQGVEVGVFVDDFAARTCEHRPGGPRFFDVPVPTRGVHTHEEMVGDGSHAPHVCSSRRSVALLPLQLQWIQDLRSCVGVAAILHHGVHGIEDIGQTEVCNFNLRVGKLRSQQQRARPQVLVPNVLAVAVMQGDQSLSDVVDDRLLLEPIAIIYDATGPLCQVAAHELFEN
mmetsp:Transcript_94673/g.197799  ORF Transcript_94673/g.197799 Transcript_94673/m.197799 type:complete len:227 (+) Transcript_94673:588-1268(+)